MSDSASYESRLWSLLEENRLADLSQYHKPGFLDEVPLVSRQADIQFLPRNEKQANEILLSFALKLLKAVVAYEQHPTGYAAAITIWDFGDVPAIPNLFVWCDVSLREMREKLPLRSVATRFGKRIEKLASGLILGDEVKALEDVLTVPDTTRVFLTPSRPIYNRFVVLNPALKAARVPKL